MALAARTALQDALNRGGRQENAGRLRKVLQHNKHVPVQPRTNVAEAANDLLFRAQRRGDQRAYLALDTRYHAAFLAYCGNNYLRDSYERYVGKIAALRTHLAIKPLHTKMSFQEHQRMLEKIKSRDVAGTIAILDVHIARTRETYANEIEDIAAADKEISEAS